MRAKKSKNVNDQGFRLLVNFRLIVGVKKLLIADGDLDEIEKVKTVMEDLNPGIEFVIEDFAVDLGVRAKIGISYKQFEKASGYSLWQILK